MIGRRPRELSIRMRTACLIAFAFIVGGCSDFDAGVESSPGGRAPGTTVEVQLVDFGIEIPDTLDTGVVTFAVTNAGDRVHGFKIVGAGLEEELDQTLEPGESRELSVSLKFGTYEVWCPVGDHRERGMMASIQVVPVSEPSPQVYPSR